MGPAHSQWQERRKKNEAFILGRVCSKAETAPTMKSVACTSECEKGAFCDVANESISVSRSLDQHRGRVPVFIFFLTSRDEGGVVRGDDAHFQRASRILWLITCNGSLNHHSHMKTFRVHRHRRRCPGEEETERRRTLPLSTHLPHERRLPTKVLQSERS